MTVTNQNKSVLNQEEFEFWLCLLPFCPEPYVFCLSWNVKIRIFTTNFVCGYEWVQSLACDIKGETWTEGVWEQDAEENIWTEEGWIDRRVEKIDLYSSPGIIRESKSRMSWAGHVGWMRRRGLGYWWENQRKRDQ
jgi:hypothetical protein